MTKLCARLTIFSLGLLSFVNAGAETFYPSVPEIPFQWDKPNTLVDLKKLGSSLPLGEFLLTSKFVKDNKFETVDDCKIKLANEDGSIRLEYSGTGTILSTGTAGPSQATGSISIPKEHFVQPLRESPFTFFAFPDVITVTGKIESNNNSKVLSLTIYRGILISKTANTPWVSSFADIEGLTLSFDDSGTKLLSISTTSTELMTLIRCESKQGILLPQTLDSQNIFLADFPN